MPYVERDGSGNIIGVFARPQPGRAEELLAGDDAEVVAFRSKLPAAVDYETFEARFTEAERDGMTNFIYATDTNGIPARPKVIQEFTRVVARGRIDLTAAKTASFMAALVSAGVLTQARSDEILTP